MIFISVWEGEWLYIREFDTHNTYLLMLGVLCIHDTRKDDTNNNNITATIKNVDRNKQREFPRPEKLCNKTTRKRRKRN